GAQRIPHLPLARDRGRSSRGSASPAGIPLACLPSDRTQARRRRDPAGRGRELPPAGNQSGSALDVLDGASLVVRAVLRSRGSYVRGSAPARIAAKARVVAVIARL